MEGKNSLILNHATVVEMLQYYFDNVLFADGQSPTVEDVEQDKTSYGPEEFKVRITASDKPESDA